MVSLLHLAEIKEEGVTFQSPVDGSEMLLTPEESIGIQNRLGGSDRQIGLKINEVKGVRPRGTSYLHEPSSATGVGETWCLLGGD